MAWVVRSDPWYRVDVQYCEVTGQLLPSRFWQFEYDGRLINARDPRAEALYREYVVGQAAAPASSDLE